MKKLLLLLVPCLALAQTGVRVDPTPAFTVSSQSGAGLNPMLAIAGSQVQICNAPASGIPCSNFATTYTDSSLTVACPSLQQIVLRGTNNCTANADNQGNFGFWLATGQYAYQFTTPSGQLYGPYPLTVASGGGGISMLTGDVAASGTGIVNATVNGIKGIPITGTPTAVGQSLFYNGTAWVPSSISVTWPLQSTGGVSPTFTVPVTSNYAADSGTLNAYVATLSPAPSAYASGMVVYLYPASTNTSATPTLNVNSLGAVQIQKGTPSGLNPLLASDILMGVPAEFIYRPGGVWVLLNPQTATSSGSCTGCLTEPPSRAGVIAASVGSTVTQVVNLVVGVGANTNIAATVANCPPSPTVCDIEIPATYTGGDQIQGFSQNYTVADQSTYASNVVFNDFRTGNSWSVSGNCLYASFSCSFFNDSNVVTSFPQPVTGFRFHKDSLMAGGSFQTTNFTNYNADFYQFFSKTPGQAQVMDVQAISTTGNDILVRDDTLNCVGYRGVPGFNEGCEAQDLLVYQGIINYGSGDWEGVSGTTGTGMHTLNISTPIQLSGSFGPNRDIINLTAGPSYTTTATSYNCPGTAPCSVTVPATLPVSPAYGSVAAAVTAPGPQAVTPTLTSGAVSNFSTTQLVCVVEPMGEPERIFPSAVGATTVTLNFTFMHAAGYLIYTGGLCGYNFDAAQDDLTSASFPNLGNATAGGVTGTSIVGTAHRQFFIAGTTSANTIVVAYHEGFWPNFSGNTNLQNGGTVNIWKAASVLAIGASPGLDSGYSGGNITLADNILTVSSGQTIAQPMGPTMRITYGGCNLINLWGNNANTGGSSHGCNYGGMMTYNDSFESAANYTPPSFYSLGGGTRALPERSFGFDSPALYQNLQGFTGQNADIAFAKCYQVFFSSTCNDANHTVIQEPNAGTGLAADYFRYDELNQWFKFTYANGNATQILNGTSETVSLSWVSGASYVQGAVVFYGTTLYKNLTGTNTSTNPSADVTNWASVGGGSSSLPTTGTTNGQYAPIATVTGGTATNVYAATLITQPPSCAAMGTTYTITGATNASPIVITTSAANGLYTNEWVTVAGVGGNTAANGLFQITVLTTTTFSLNSSTGSAAYTSGGTALNASSAPYCTTASGLSGAYQYPNTLTGAYNVSSSDVYGLDIANSSTAVAWTLPQANVGSNFVNGSWIDISNAGAGILTISASGGSQFCTASSVCTSTYAVSQGHFVHLASQGGNYYIGAHY